MNVTLSHPKNRAIKKSTFCTTSRLVPTNDCLLFVHVKLVFVTLLSGTVWVDGSSPIFICRATNFYHLKCQKSIERSVKRIISRILLLMTNKSYRYLFLLPFLSSNVQSLMKIVKQSARIFWYM